MWTLISKALLQIVMFVMSDKALVSGAKSMISKAVDSTVYKVGITNEDAKDIISSITDSSLNMLDKKIVETVDEMMENKKDVS